MQCLALLTHSRRSQVRFQGLGAFSVEFACSAWVIPGFFLLPQFKDTHIRLMGNYKLPVGVRIVDSQPTANAGNNYV